MKVVNPLFRKQNDKETIANSGSCYCLCNVASGNWNSGYNPGYYASFTYCGCACSSSTANQNANSYNAINRN